MRVFGALVVAMCLFAGTVRRAEPSPLRRAHATILDEAHGAVLAPVLSHRRASAPRVSLSPFTAPDAAIAPIPERACALVSTTFVDDISDVQPPQPCSRGPPFAR